MQSLPVYLYANLFEVTLDLTSNTRIRQVMYQRPLKIQKGVKNTIQVQFKNSDQKLLNIHGKNFKMYVYDSFGDRTLVVSKNLTVLDVGSTSTFYTTKGLAEISFSDKDIQTVESKSYNFSIVEVDQQGEETATYSNTYYDVSGTLEIKDEVVPKFRPSIEISNFQRFYNSNPDKLHWEYNTGNIRVYPDRLNKTATHTVAFYLNNFKGTVVVEGTLENEPSTYGRYAIIDSKNYTTNTTGVGYFTFVGLFTHIKFTYIPSKNPVSGDNSEISYSGTLDKVLIRS
jgi:uncharacterized protein YcfL